jgi:hypothetical protein
MAKKKIEDKDRPEAGPGSKGHPFGPVKPIIPKAQKPTGVENHDDGHKSRPQSQRGKSQEKISKYRKEDSGFELTAEGQRAYEALVESAPKVDLTKLATIQERIPGDANKLVKVLENLALGARHREALADVDWTWSDLSVYRTRFPVVSELYKEVSRLGEETRKVLRLDEAHRRAVDGVEEDMYSASGKYCGKRIKYSDALLTLFLKADHPDKFSEKHEVKQSGVILNMNLGLRDHVRDTPLEQGDIKVTSPFADEKKEDLPGGV